MIQFADVITSLIEMENISIAGEQQDERDKQAISLTGYAD